MPDFLASWLDYSHHRIVQSPVADPDEGNIQSGISGDTWATRSRCLLHSRRPLYLDMLASSSSANGTSNRIFRILYSPSSSADGQTHKVGLKMRLLGRTDPCLQHPGCCQTKECHHLLVRSRCAACWHLSFLDLDPAWETTLFTKARCSVRYLISLQYALFSISQASCVAAAPQFTSSVQKAPLSYHRQWFQTVVLCEEYFRHPRPGNLSCKPCQPYI